MDVLSSYITDILVEYNFVCEDKREICKYGLENLMISFLEIISVLMFSCFLGNFECTLLFIITLVTMRRYTGGYHAKTRGGCYAVLVSAYLILCIMLEYFPRQYCGVFAIFVLLLSNYMVMRYAPIVYSNKIIDSDERRAFRKFSIMLVRLFSVIIIVGIIIRSQSKGILSVVLGLMIVSLSMIMALHGKGGEKSEKNV